LARKRKREVVELGGRRRKVAVGVGVRVTRARRDRVGDEVSRGGTGGFGRKLVRVVLRKKPVRHLFRDGGSTYLRITHVN
jgi:hypothetical protein